MPIGRKGRYYKVNRVDPFTGLSLSKLAAGTLVYLSNGAQLTVKENSALGYLLEERPGQVFSREDLFTHTEWEVRRGAS